MRYQNRFWVRGRANCGGRRLGGFARGGRMRRGLTGSAVTKPLNTSAPVTPGILSMPMVTSKARIWRIFRAQPLAEDSGGDVGNRTPMQSRQSAPSIAARTAAAEPARDRFQMQFVRFVDQRLGRRQSCERNGMRLYQSDHRLRQTKPADLGIEENGRRAGFCDPGSDPPDGEGELVRIAARSREIEWLVGRVDGQRCDVGR